MSNNTNLKKIKEVFDIDLVETKKLPRKYDYSYIYKDFNSAYDPYNQIPVKYDEVHILAVPDNFLRVLIDLIDYYDNTHRIGSYDSIPSLTYLYDYLEDTYLEKNKTAQLHREHPELAEIMRDYNAMKALVSKSK